MSRAIIYALVDEFGQPRYIGQTKKRLSLRLSQHYSASRLGRQRKLEEWQREAKEVMP